MLPMMASSRGAFSRRQIKSTQELVVAAEISCKIIPNLENLEFLLEINFRV